MKNFQRGFSPIFLLLAALLIIGGGAYLYTQGDLPIGGGGWKTYSDPQGTYTIKVPSDLSTYVSLSPGTNYRMSEKLIAGGARSGWSTGAEIALVNNSDYDSFWSPTINSAKTREDISIGGTSGYIWSSSFSPGSGAANLNELAALSGPIANSSYRLYIVIHNVKDTDVGQYSDLLKQIAATVSLQMSQNYPDISTTQQTQAQSQTTNAPVVQPAANTPTKTTPIQTSAQTKTVTDTTHSFQIIVPTSWTEVALTSASGNYIVSFFPSSDPIGLKTANIGLIVLKATTTQPAFEAGLTPPFGKSYIPTKAINVTNSSIIIPGADEASIHTFTYTVGANTSFYEVIDVYKNGHEIQLQGASNSASASTYLSVMKQILQSFKLI